MRFLSKLVLSAAPGMGHVCMSNNQSGSEKSSVSDLIRPAVLPICALSQLYASSVTGISPTTMGGFGCIALRSCSDFKHCIVPFDTI